MEHFKNKTTNPIYNTSIKNVLKWGEKKCYFGTQEHPSTWIALQDLQALVPCKTRYTGFPNLKEYIR